jgi:hypothetical protein
VGALKPASVFRATVFVFPAEAVVVLAQGGAVWTGVVVVCAEDGVFMAQDGVFCA